MPDVVMYMSPYCPYCTRARALLEGKGVQPAEISVEGNRAQLRAMIQRSRRNTVPQIFIGDLHVGGFDDLALLDSRGELDPLLGR